jgi:CRISPR-associated protein Csd2
MAKTDHHPHDRSAARGLYVFKHNSELGYAPAHVLFERIQIKKMMDVPRC